MAISLPNNWICKKYFVHTYYVSKASTDVKMSTFFGKNGGWGCGSRNGPLSALYIFSNFQGWYKSVFQNHLKLILKCTISNLA